MEKNEEEAELEKEFKKLADEVVDREELSKEMQMPEVDEKEDLGEAVERKKEKLSPIEELTSRLEKIELKIDIEVAKRAGIDDRLSQLSERIGEIRSTVIERDRSFRNIESEFEKNKAMIEAIRPDEFRKELTEMEKKIIQDKSRVERVENMNDKLNEEITSFRKTFIEDIKSFENLVAQSKEIEDKIKKIEDTKRYTDRSAAKVESIFSELTKRLVDVERQKEKIETHSEMLDDLVKSVDKAELKLEDTVREKDMKKYMERRDVKELLGSVGEKDLRALNDSLRKINDVEGRVDKLAKSMGRVDKLEAKLNDAVMSKDINRYTRKDEFNQAMSESSQKMRDIEGSLDDLVKSMDRAEARFNNAVMSKDLDRYVKRNDLKQAMSESSQKMRDIEVSLSDLVGSMNGVEAKVNDAVRSKDLNRYIRKDDLKQAMSESSQRVNDLEEKVHELYLFAKGEKEIDDISEIMEGGAGRGVLKGGYERLKKVFNV